MIFHLLLLFPVEIPKIKTNLIFIIVNALHFGLWFYSASCYVVAGTVKRWKRYTKGMFFCTLACFVIWDYFSHYKSGNVVFSEVVARYFSRGFIEKYNSFEAKVPLIEKQVSDFQLQYPWKTPVEECHCNKSCWLLRESCNLTSRTKFRVVQFKKDTFIQWNLGNAMLMQTLIVQRLM